MNRLFLVFAVFVVAVSALDVFRPVQIEVRTASRENRTEWQYSGPLRSRIYKTPAATICEDLSLAAIDAFHNQSRIFFYNDETRPLLTDLSEKLGTDSFDAAVWVAEGSAADCGQGEVEVVAPNPRPVPSAKSGVVLEAFLPGATGQTVLVIAPMEDLGIIPAHPVAGAGALGAAISLATLQSVHHVAEVGELDRSLLVMFVTHLDDGSILDRWMVKNPRWAEHVDDVVILRDLCDLQIEVSEDDTLSHLFNESAVTVTYVGAPIQRVSTECVDPDLSTIAEKVTRYVYSKLDLDERLYGGQAVMEGGELSAFFTHFGNTLRHHFFAKLKKNGQREFKDIQEFIEDRIEDLCPSCISRNFPLSSFLHESRLVAPLQGDLRIYEPQEIDLGLLGAVAFVCLLFAVSFYYSYNQVHKRAQQARDQPTIRTKKRRSKHKKRS